MKMKDLRSLIPDRPAPYQAEGFGSGFDDYDAPRLAKVGQDGVSFKSHLDGSIHYITPEKSIQIQHNLGADIIFAFDECTSPSEDLRYQEEALARTHRWAERSLAEHQRLSAEEKASLAGSLSGLASPALPLGASACETPRNETFSSALFGIVQGGRDENLRKKSAVAGGGVSENGSSVHFGRPLMLPIVSTLDTIGSCWRRVTCPTAVRSDAPADLGTAGPDLMGDG